MIATAADDQQWDAFMLTDVVQDRSEVEQKRALEERGKEIGCPTDDGWVMGNAW
jgi:hypothetical protein